MSRPTPKLLSALRRPQVLSTAQVGEAAQVVRPQQSVEIETFVHDGVVKAKHLRPGQVVRSWLHDAPRGSVKVVESATRVGDGSTVEVTFSSGQPPVTVKAAYRFYDETLVGKVVSHRVTVARFVAVR